MAAIPDRCPYLAPVMADRLWMYPMPAYCRRPDRPVKVPGRHSILRVCSTVEYARCPGYLQSVGRSVEPDS